MHDLIVVENLTPTEVFTDKGADAILDQIEKEARTALIDISTETGRKECASIAYKIARSKTFLDDMGKDLVAEWKSKSARVDAERRKIRDRLDILKDEIRKPLTEFENTEKTRIETHENQIATIQALGALTSGSLHEINTNLEAISTIMQRDWEEFGKRATEVADATRATLQSQLTARQKYEDDQAELQRLRDEHAEREQAEREDRIRREAAEKAQRDAEAAIAASKAREEDAQRAAEQAKLDAERQAKQAAEAAEKAAKEAAAKAKREAQEAAANAEREKQAAIEAERARVAKIKADEEAEAAKREADHKHKAKINHEALAAISIAGGINEDTGKLIIEAIARGAIPHVHISY